MLKFDKLSCYDSSLVLQIPSRWDAEILGLTNIENPLPHHLAFIKDEIFLHKFFGHVKKQQAKGQMGFVVEEDLWRKQSPEVQALAQWGFVATSNDVALALARLSLPFYQLKMKRYKDKDLVDGRQMEEAKVHPTAWIAQGVFIGSDVIVREKARIYHGAVILSGSEIGCETVIYPNVVIYNNVKIGDNCRIHSGAVIGSDGFGHTFKDKTHHKIWHMGGVTIGNDVEVGANTSIDSGTFSATSIGPGSKIDNHVEVAHNCQIGKGVILCAHAALGGSSKVGDFCIFGGKSGMGDNLSIGKNCQIAGGALLNMDWPDGVVLAGHPARPLREWLSGVAYVRKKSFKQQ